MSENSRDKVVTLVYAFTMPVLLALPAFAAVGIYPFGDKSMLIIDMYNEYVDYLAQMNETVRFSGSFLRSWNMGMGLNMLGLIAFYTASPFNLIILLLPLSVITEAIFAVTLLKLGAAGLFFAIFARKIFPQADKSLHVAFSVAYALCGYNIAYSSNIMWLDGVAFLPLVLLGVERILRGERYRLFLFSLIYVFFTSYYIGFMIGIFSFLYFTASCFSKAEPSWKSSMRAYARILPRFIGSAALAAGCCAFLLLPAFLGLRDGQSEMWSETFAFTLRFPVIRLASKLLPGVYDSLTDSGLPNIYCTVLGIILCTLYFCTKAVPRREKFIFGGLLAFMLFSFSCEFFDVAWHAFEVPTWFPARYSFLFSFLVLFLALRCACVLQNVSRRAIIASALLLLLLFAEIAVSRFRYVTAKSVVASVLLALLYTAVFLLWKLEKNTNRRELRTSPCAFHLRFVPGLVHGHKHEKYNRRVLSALLIVFACIEAFGSAVFTVSGMDAQFAYKNRREYQDFMQNYGGAVQYVKSVDEGVYRSEILGARNANGSMALGYNGISHYSTTTNQKLNQFLRDLGYNKGTENELRFSASTPVTNGLLGIKYVLSETALGDAYMLRAEVGDIGVYENTAVFPLAFWAPPEAADFESDSKNPFQLQNALISSLTGESSAVFTPLSVSAPILTNAEKSLNDGGYISYSRQNHNRQASVEFEVFNPRQNEAFAFFPVYDGKFSSSDVFINGIFAGRDLTYRANTVIPLGNAVRPSLELVPRGDMIRVETEYFAALDLNAAKKAAETAAQNQMQFTKFLDTSVDGTIFAPADGLLATTFPLDSGWTVKIDGQTVRQVPLAGVFLAVPVTAGEHSVTMRYLPPGFGLGVAITAISVFGMLFFFWKKHSAVNQIENRQA